MLYLQFGDENETSSLSDLDVNSNDKQFNVEVINLGPLVKLASAKRVHRQVNFSDRLMYIYTSGTTGLPKASIITHHKYILRSSMNFFPGISGNRHTVYCPLPLYHSLAGNGALGMCLLYGHTMVMRSKFSTTAFWTDVIKHDCSMFIYVGELCRYLLASPASDIDRSHSLQLMVGVGLRRNLWSKFRARFGIEHILESYGSTEANCSLSRLQDMQEN